MDTPDRSHPPPQQQQLQAGGNPVSRFEDSPVFNYINSLSPINPVKTVHVAQAFHSPGFGANSSIFTSPHVSLPKESRFMTRCTLTDKAEPSSLNAGETSMCVHVSSNDDSSFADVTMKDSGKVVCSLNEATPSPLVKSVSSFLSSQSSQYYCGSPDPNITHNYDVETDLKLDVNDTYMVELVPDSLVRHLGKVISRTGSQGGCHSDQAKEESSESEWKNLLKDDADDFPVYERNDEESEGQDFNANMISDQNGIGHASHNFVVSKFQQKSSNSSGKLDDYLSGTATSSCKVQTQQKQSGISRRLLFEMAGKRNAHIGLSNKPAPLTGGGKDLPSCTQSGFSKIGSAPPRCLLPGIGLHLNALTSKSLDRNDVQDEASQPCKKASDMESAALSFPATSTHLNVIHGLSEEIQELHVKQEALEDRMDGKSEDLSQNSPKKKKQKLENNSERDACRRCNCKKSKCLKLYCECFASGVYCTEPCACQGCLNNPSHEDTVLATRKQIESRNPLAFAPKVVRVPEPVMEGDDANKTPASVRHKRGCNCKKSSCLKKYCECFQGGAGCSMSCRCEGCKNKFGTRDGTIPVETDETQHEEEDIDPCLVGGGKLNYQQDAIILHSDHSDKSLFMVQPVQMFRPSVKLSFSSGKPPLSPMVADGQAPRLNICKVLLKPKSEPAKPSSEKQLDSAIEVDTTEILSDHSSPVTVTKVASPKRKRVSPPHSGTGLLAPHKGCRKLILKSIPSLPSLFCDSKDDQSADHTES